MRPRALTGRGALIFLPVKKNLREREFNLIDDITHSERRVKVWCVPGA
jgi:hypothetical protein